MNQRMYEFTHLDLCSGTGAASIAFEREGFQTIGFAEIDPFCSRLLAHHWPHVRNYGDIRTVPAISCTVITCGDPCQPFSCAGRRKGETDDRYLWQAVLANVERCQADFFLGENVTGIANMVLSRRIDDLENRGYQSKAFDIPSCAVGLPSLERHIWIVASRRKTWLEGRSETGLSRPADDQCNGGTIHSRIACISQRWNLPKPDLLRSRKGFPNHMDRIAAIGNAFPPPICQIFAQAIRETITQ